MKRALTASLIFLTLSTALAGGGRAAVTTRSLTLKLGDQSSRAELLLPADATRPAPLVLLIQGTGPEDLNGSFATYGGVVQGSLGKLAQTLAARGFAVMRYDKRYAAQTFDPRTAQAAQNGYNKLTLKDLLSDARTALKTAEAQPGVNSRKVFVYGWSEGTVVAAALAQEIHASGLVLQGPVVDSFASSFARQFQTVGMTYLNTYARDGKIDLSGVLAALQGPGSGLAKMQASLLLSLDSTPQAPKLAAMLDTNGDGLLDLKQEVLPRVSNFYQRTTAQSPLYAGSGTLPVLGTVAPQLKLPVLILQGENDGNIDSAYAKKLNRLLPDSTLKLYPGLGHSLGQAASITQDDFAPMQQAPMNDMAAWLAQH